MREVRLSDASLSADVATVLELPPALLPHPAPDEDPATGWPISRRVGGLVL